MPTNTEIRRCACGYELRDYAPTESQCGACATERKESKWQTRARHDADDLRRVADEIAALQQANLNAERFGAEYVRLSKAAGEIAEDMWQAAMAAWSGDLWPSD